MKDDIRYITLDGRGETESFKDCVLDTLKKLGPEEGLHVIKEFEPFPLYSLIRKKGMDKYVEKKGEEEYHIWFFPKKEIEDIEMKKYLNIDNERIKKMLDIKFKVFSRELTPDQAKKLVKETFDHITAEEFAYGEQHLLNYGITDEVMVDGMDDILDVFKDVLVVESLNLPKGHPIQTYADEAAALEQLLLEMEMKLKATFIKNEWLDLYSRLNQINTHFSRKQHQLFPALERKGFDRPSKIMWTFDNKVRDAIKEAYELLTADRDNAFLEAQATVFYLVRDILGKERDVLYPTSLELINDEEFVKMRISDDEIGYCLIENPPAYTGHANKSVVSQPEKSSDKTSNLLKDLKEVLEKHGVNAPETKNEVMDVSMGRLTLEQINLVFKHMQVDLSYVDENDIVKFYTDTKHRVFPRSAGVIGRMVQNCHPRESVATVEDIIKAFRSGKQDEAEFWLEMGDKFIYIIYNAVRDDQGNFRGVLEMMQDVTHIRSLKGSQKLLSWNNDKTEDHLKETSPVPAEENKYGITPGTIIGSLIKEYPFIKEYLVSLSPKYSQLNNPVIFKTMKNIATLDMISKRGGFKVEDLMRMIIGKIDQQDK